MKPNISVLGIALLTVIVSVIVYFNAGMLGITGVVMCYLLVVLTGAYLLRMSYALVLALITSLLINFLAIEPRYTFRIANVESWVALIAFLLVSLVVTSLVRRLQERTSEAEAARNEAEFARLLVEKLAEESQPEKLLAKAADMLQAHLDRPLCIVSQAGNDTKTVPENSACDPDMAAVNWVMLNGKPLGPGTGNWPESAILMMPFSRLPGSESVLAMSIAPIGNSPVTNTSNETRYFLPMLRSLCDQVALAYQRAASMQQAQHAELKARTEAMQNALLTSLSHDMRTPLTAIMGAASTLDSQHQQLDDASRQQLLGAIRSEADYLCHATENILSLAKLDTLGAKGLRLDWQSPEELIGSTLARYKSRELPCELKAVITSDALIRVDAILLSQALANLLDNALQVHRGNEPLLISAAQEDTNLVIAVADRGPGFPPSFSVTNLDKFQSRHGRGFGIGLVIVSTIASLHEARLEFKARSGGGAEVRLVLPLANHSLEPQG